MSSSSHSDKIENNYIKIKRYNYSKHKMETEKIQAFIGLENLGNTCFLNTCIQILAHTPELNDLLLSPKHISTQDEDNPNRAITREWLEIYRDMINQKSQQVLMSPKRFVYFVQKMAKEKGHDLFTGWSQNDFTEFLYFVVDCFHTYMSRGVELKIHGEPKNGHDQIAITCYEYLKQIYSREYSEINQLMNGIYMSEIFSEDEKTCYSVKPETFFILDLEISPIVATGDCSLDDCFQYFTRGEKMSGEDAWFNEKTGVHEPIVKKMSFWSFPKILVISLKRFINENDKKETAVHFPLKNLDLSPYVCGYNRSKYVYDLYAVCNHSGKNDAGHYTAFICRNDEWYAYNDTQIFKVNPQHVISPYAYCLFYSLRTEKKS